MYPIVTVSDTKYLPSVQFCLESILYTYKGNERLKFYVLSHSSDISQKEIDDFLYFFSADNVDVKFVTSPDLESSETMAVFENYAEKKTKYLNDLGHGQRVVPNWRALRKVWLHDAVPEEKVLYLDCDTYLYGNIQHIFDFKTKMPFAAALDPWPSTWTQLGGIFNKIVPGANLFNWTHLSHPYMSYFNTGVFIADLNYWREHKLHEKAKQLMDEYIILYTDQDLLNYFFKDNFMVLPIQFNSQGKMLVKANFGIDYTNEPGAPVVVHFASSFKPCFKKFNQYQLYDTPEGETVDNLPAEYYVPAFTRYNMIKRRVMIKELYMSMLKRKPGYIDEEGLMKYVNSTMDMATVARDMKNSSEYKVNK